MKKKGSILPGIFILLFGIYLILSALKIDVLSYLFFPGWIGVLIAAVGVIDIVKSKQVSRGIIFIFVGAAIALYIIGFIDLNLCIGICVAFIGLVFLIKALINKYGDKGNGKA